MSFIHSILFGFPSKQQSELRYEPKKGAKYGGQLVVQFEESGKVMIERVKGKSAGDVSVLLEDGTTGGEELLKDLLSFVDKNLYQSIFSFNLHGLQNVHNLRSEDLGKFLFSTGAIGTDRLLTVESNLEKEMDARFKPNGKKPSLNEKIKEVKEIYNELKRAEKENDQYSSLVRSKESLQLKIEDEQKRKDELHRKQQKLEVWKKLTPIVRERNLLQVELDGDEEISFPIDGIVRLEQLNSYLQPIEGHLKALSEKEEKLTKELNNVKPNRDWIEKEAEINASIEKLPLFEVLKEEQGEWLSKRTQIMREIQDLKERLHISVNPESLSDMNTSIFMQEKIEKAAVKQRKIKERKNELDQAFNQEKEELERIEHQVDHLQKELLHPKERSEKEQKVERARNYQSIENEMKNVQEQLRLLTMAVKKEQEQAKQNGMFMLFITALFIMLASWGIWKSQWFLMAMGGIGALLILFFFFQKKETNVQKELKKEIQGLRHREQALARQSSDVSPSELQFLDEQLKKDTMLQEQMIILKLQWKQQSNLYEKVIHSFEAWEKECVEHNHLLKELGRELHLPHEIALNHIYDAFLLFVKWKEYVREYDYIDKQLEKKTEQLEKIERDIKNLNSLFLQDDTLSLQESAFALKNQLKRELEKTQQYESILKKLRELTSECEELKEKYAHFSQEKEKLFAMANVQTEEEFRQVGKLEEKRSLTLKRIEELDRQLDLSSIKKDEIVHLVRLNDVDEEIEEVKASLEACELEIAQSQQLFAEIKHKITIIEEGGVYADLLHKYHLLQSELDLEAKEWARFALAKEMLKKTVERFKNEHLPNMLSKAEEYLAFLTDGNYRRIIPRVDSSGFIIERKDLIHFDANELSQATTEQVFVSLRLALATTIYRRYSFPILIDDSFVNFDHIRTEKVMKLLKSIDSNQVLFFTCHQHLLPFFNNEQIVLMEEITSLA